MKTFVIKHALQQLDNHIVIMHRLMAKPQISAVEDNIVNYKSTKLVKVSVNGKAFLKIYF